MLRTQGLGNDVEPGECARDPGLPLTEDRHGLVVQNRIEHEAPEDPGSKQGDHRIEADAALTDTCTSRGLPESKKICTCLLPAGSQKFTSRVPCGPAPWPRSYSSTSRAARALRRDPSPPSNLTQGLGHASLPPQVAFEPTLGTASHFRYPRYTYTATGSMPKQQTRLFVSSLSSLRSGPVAPVDASHTSTPKSHKPKQSTPKRKWDKAGAQLRLCVVESAAKSLIEQRDLLLSENIGFPANGGMLKRHAHLRYDRW